MARFRRKFSRNQLAADLSEEMRQHLEEKIETLIAGGMPREEAVHAARRAFGNATLIEQRSREVWMWPLVESIWADIKFALRQLRKSPGFTVTVVLTLALGFGSVATLLAIVDCVLFRPVAIPHPHQLVMLYGKTHQDGSLTELSYSQIETLQRKDGLFTAVAGYAPKFKPVGSLSGTRSTAVIQVTPGFFQMLDVQAELGRLPDAHGTAPVAVVSHEFWEERLHSDPHAIGSLIEIDGEARTIVGILPRGVSVPSGTGGSFVYTPISLHAKQNGPLSFGAAYVMARMKPGVSMAQALAESRSILGYSKTQNGVASRDLEMQSYATYLTGNLHQPLFILFAGVLILLMIALANAANLQIARAMERMTEMQVRSVLGASFGRLLQQLLAESVVISLLGAAFGCMVAYGSTAVIRSVYGGQFARFREIAIHPIVFVVIALLAAISGILASLAPAFSVRRRTRAAAVTQRATPRTRVSSFLVVLQIALTCVLLTTAGMLVRTFRALQQVPLGFNPHHVTTLLLMPADSHESPVALRQTDTRLLERFQSLPGVESAAMQTSIPFSSYSFSMEGTTDVSGRSYLKGDSAFYSFVSSNFVRASGIHLLRGRGFVMQDDTSPEIVALVNQAFVHKFLPGRDPLGVSLKLHRDPGDKESDIPLTRSYSIVGVVQNELQGGTLGAAFEPMVYLDYRQLPRDSAFLGLFGMMSEFAIRSRLPQSILDNELRATLKQIAPNMAEMRMQPMEKGIAQSLGERSLALRLVSSFGAIALLLAAIGIYGTLAYAVTLRRKEIGIRMALGSSRARVTRLVLRQAGQMVLIGIVPGLAGAWASGYALRSFLFGVKPLDPASLVAAVSVLLLTGLLAAWWPARRAASVDPMVALRAE